MRIDLKIVTKYDLDLLEQNVEVRLIRPFPMTLLQAKSLGIKKQVTALSCIVLVPTFRTITAFP